MAEQKERLKKLYVLALRGVGGEKEQAKAILDKLLKKYAFLLRCVPVRGDYNFYCYCYVKEWLDKYIEKSV